MSQNIQKHPHRGAAMLTDMLPCICMLKHITKHQFIYPSKDKKKNEVNEQIELKY